MGEDGEAQPQCKTQDIRHSVFFEASVVKAFLEATLADDRFPAEALNRLMRPDDPAASEQSARPPTSIAIDAEQRKGLQDGVRALCTQLALTSVEVDGYEAMQKRTLLGFCRLLLGQTTEAAAEFDVVRRTRLGRKAKVDTSPVVKADQGRALTVSVLWGAELAAAERGKDAEAARYRRWRREAMDS